MPVVNRKPQEYFQKKRRVKSDDEGNVVTKAKHPTANKVIIFGKTKQQQQRSKFDEIVAEGKNLITSVILKKLSEAQVFKTGRLLYACSRRGVKISQEALLVLHKMSIYPPNQYVVS